MYAYVLMSNQVHLLIETGTVGFSKITLGSSCGFGSPGMSCWVIELLRDGSATLGARIALCVIGSSKRKNVKFRADELFLR